MQIKQKKASRKTILSTTIVIAAVLLVSLGLYWVFVVGKTSPQTNTIDSGSDTPSVKNETPTPNTDTTIDKTTDEIPTDAKGSITINSFTQKNGVVTVRASTSDFAATKCVYSFTIDGGKPVVKEQKNACQTMSLSQELFDKIGTYKLTVTAYSANDKIAVSREVDIE